MNRIEVSFLITLFAGLSTLLGYFIIFINKKNINNIIVKSLSFASAVMITISIIDLIPESYKILKLQFKLFPLFLLILICINIGVILSFNIKKYIPKYDNSLYKTGVLSMIVIILHNIPEGIITFMTSTNNITLGISLSIAIALHNIPEGISIAVPIYYSKNSKFKAFLYTFMAGLSEFLGAVITYLFLRKFINELTIGLLLSIVAGIMIYIGITELLPESLHYNKKNITLKYFIIGILFVVFSQFLF